MARGAQLVELAMGAGVSRRQARDLELGPASYGISTQRGSGMGLVCRGLALIGLGVMAACSPQQAADAVSYRAAEQVAGPIVSRYMQPAQAAGVTQCILRAATGDELRSLAQDIGTSGGTRPVSTLLTLAARPQARQCILSAGLPMLPGVL